MSQKELVKYPPLGFDLGGFIGDKVYITDNEKKVKNVLYYTNAKIVRGFEYDEKKKTFVDWITERDEMEEEDIMAELTDLMIEEDRAVEIRKKKAEADEVLLEEMRAESSLDEEVGDEEDEDSREEESEK